MKNNVPAEIRLLQDAQVIPLSTTMKATIPAGTNAATGLTLENRTDNYNNKNIIGIALRINSAGGTKTATNGNLLIEQNYADNAFLEIKNGSDTILDNINLAALIPPVGKSYVPIWIPIFTPSKSKFTFSGVLNDAAARDIEFIFIHTDL